MSKFMAIVLFVLFSIKNLREEIYLKLLKDTVDDILIEILEQNDRCNANYLIFYQYGTHLYPLMLVHLGYFIPLLITNSNYFSDKYVLLEIFHITIGGTFSNQR